MLLLLLRLWMLLHCKRGAGVIARKLRQRGERQVNHTLTTNIHPAYARPANTQMKTQ